MSRNVNEARRLEAAYNDALPKYKALGTRAFVYKAQAAQEASGEAVTFTAESDRDAMEAYYNDFYRRCGA